MTAALTSCPEYQQLKRCYESALRESALYEAGGPASFQQARRFRKVAKTAAHHAGSCLNHHRELCQFCRNAESNRREAGDWDDLREEVFTFLAIGSKKGEPELDTMIRLLWMERHRNVLLSNALAVMQREMATQPERDQRSIGGMDNVLAWKK